jgi:hypothetical protein
MVRARIGPIGLTAHLFPGLNSACLMFQYKPLTEYLRPQTDLVTSF